MNRRGFLGSLIGFVAATAVLPQAEFFALPESAEWQRVILPYRALFRDTGSGYTIQAPGIISVEDVFNGKRFVAEPLTADQYMRLDRFILMDDRGKVLHDETAQAFHLVAGDSLSVTFTVPKIA